MEDLPYDYNALEPHLSARTLQFHHDKHHARYVATTNDLIKGTEMENDNIVTIIRKAHQTKNTALFNNAGQSFNHDFYWKSMKPNGGGKPTEGSKIDTLIQKDFGSFDGFRDQFKKAAIGVFGSGWAWLVHTPAGLKVSPKLSINIPQVSLSFIPCLFSRSPKPSEQVIHLLSLTKLLC